MSEPSPRWHQSRTVQLTIGLLVTAGCLVWAFYEMCRDDPPSVVLRQIGSAFASANYLTLVPMLIALAIFYWLKTWRWQMLLRPLGHFPLRTLFGPLMIGFAFNNLLPAHLGEFVRVFVASRDQKLPMPAVLSSVVLERVF
ncbi:MAG: lysylphosphatidylglycerol synthase transmembrane domain-containing protein, partial [Maioricimonas sp. JB049]